LLSNVRLADRVVEMKFQFAAAFFCSMATFGLTAAETPSARLTPVQRIETSHLKATHEARLRFARERQKLPNLGVYEDFRAVIHVHAEDSDHTKGTRPEVLAAAKKTDVQIVMFTDHRGPKPETWHGFHDGILFFAGAEDGGQGMLRFPDFNPDRTPLA
jgi:hypothetical protein